MVITAEQFWAEFILSNRPGHGEYCDCQASQGSFCFHILVVPQNV